MDTIQSLPPHGDQHIVVKGNTVNPTRALILVHGRGATAESIMSLTEHLALGDDHIALAPQAAEHTWYPNRFIRPQSENQPHLAAALDRIKAIIAYLETIYGIVPAHITLAGFSQGACLVSEYLKQNPETYNAAAILSGGLIGDDANVAEMLAGSLAGTPIYIGCDEQDFHIPVDRVERTAQVLTALGAQVELKIYKSLGHTVHPDGIQFLEKSLGGVQS